MNMQLIILLGFEICEMYCCVYDLHKSFSDITIPLLVEKKPNNLLASTFLWLGMHMNNTTCP